MTIITEFLIMPLVGYLINIAAGERSAAIAATRAAKIRGALEKDDALRKALASTHSIREEIRGACVELARNHAQLGVPNQEEPLWRLLSDDVFQEALAEWLMVGGILEGHSVKGRILQTIETALASGGATSDQIAIVKKGYFENIEKALFAHPVLAHWRHQLSLDYLREQVAVLRQRADEAVGLYLPERQKAALDRYCEKALEEWDIIDLSNLAPQDVQLASEKLLLRQLYMPLRLEIEPTKRSESSDVELARLEEDREVRRHLEAGHFFTDEFGSPTRRLTRAPVGERLTISRRLVVLGDPGGGKTTMLRWLATAYLLRHMNDAAYSQIPDTATLPCQPWIPVLIRCRELGDADLCRCFTDFLTQHLNKSDLLPDEAAIMRAVILDRIAKGEALLLVDGLDEITNPEVRMTFCMELERTATRYPSATIVVTSRIVGYRDMPYRMGSGFQHGVIAELSRKDKDSFAQRWVDVTEQEMTVVEKSKRVKSLLEALHSSNRIERLTGNPMLLTTLALVERRSGRLPNRRSELYYEAVQVLLNFNPRHRSLDKAEAIPQLAFLAFQMCRLGVQRLTEDEILSLLEKFRHEYPNYRAAKAHEPHSFLTLLEAQSSILIRAGSIWQKDDEPEKRVWEFRHLTFQEYLASRALIDGRYPDRDKSKSLADQVAPLAGTLEKLKRNRRGPDADSEAEVPESWREALRLLVAECKDDDVDAVMLAILNPAPSEDYTKTSRPRAVLAALCLADEPNISEDAAIQIIEGYVANVIMADAGGRFRTSLSAAGAEVGKCIWAEHLKQRLMQEFLRRQPEERHYFGGLWAMIEAHRAPETLEAFEPWLIDVKDRIAGGNELEQTSAAMVVVMVAFLDKALLVPGLVDSLFSLLKSSPPARYAGVWALGWLSKSAPTKWEGKEPVWCPQGAEIDALLAVLQSTEQNECDTVRWLLTVLGAGCDARAVQPSIERLEHDDVGVRRTAADVLAKLGGTQAVGPLLATLSDRDSSVRQAVIKALAQLGDTQAVTPLLAKLDDEESVVRQDAIQALAQLGDTQAVIPLLAKLEDESSEVRHAAIEALVKLGHKGAVTHLLARLDDADSDVREAVIQALAQLGDTRLVTPLLAKLDDPDSDVRQATVSALVKLGGIDAIAPLSERLSDRDPEVQQTVIRALAQLGDVQAVTPLLAMLQEANVKIAASAAIALRVLGNSIGSAAYSRFLASDDVKVRLDSVCAYAQSRDVLDKYLLSRDLDATESWIDPKIAILEDQVASGMSRLGLTSEQTRSRY